MYGRGLRWLLVALPVVALTGCERAKSENPLSPTVAGPIAGVSIDAPKPYAPQAASQIAVDRQPVTLIIDNASSNGVRPFTYIFEIATDASFSSKVFSQTGIEPGKDGRTSVQLPQSLTPERTYYWRSRADDGANASAYSAVSSFKVYTPVVIQAPALREPSDGATGTPRKPAFSVSNAQRSGPAGDIHYLFELATDGAFSNKVISVLVSEGSGQTSYTATSDLAYATRYYWRAKATDPGHESSYSNIRSFVTLDGPIVVTPPSGPTPNPNAQDHLNMSQATILNSPRDLGGWTITTAITSLDLGRNGIHAEFSKNNGPGRWPDVYPPGWDEPLQFTLGMCMNIGGWYCSAVVQFWNGLYASGGPPEQIAENWFYAADRWAPMTGHQPSIGETVGFFVCAGDCRNGGSSIAVRERSNVVLIKFPGAQGGSFRF